MRKKPIDINSIGNAEIHTYIEILEKLVETYDDNGYNMTVTQAIALYNLTLHLQIRSADAITKTIRTQSPDDVKFFINNEMDFVFDGVFNNEENLEYLDNGVSPVAGELSADMESLTEELIDYAKSVINYDPDDEEEEDLEDIELCDEFVDDEDDIPEPETPVKTGNFNMYDLTGDEQSHTIEHIAPYAQAPKNPYKAFAPAIKLSTKEIYQKLADKVYKQEEYCRAASVILYNHFRGVNSINIVSGPSGCGKTYLWETIRDDIYSNICFLDGKSISQTGFKGVNLGELLQTVPFEEGIVVIDEFDKLISASYDSHGTNISRQIQGEFLKVLDSGYIKKTERGPVFQSTDKMTFILCGSFFEKADDKAEEGKSIGFGASLETKKAYESNITLEDMIEFGLIKEIAGRITDVVNVNPLTVDDYISFIKDFNNSAVNQIEELYGRKIVISDEKIRSIAEESFKNALGLRKAIGIIKSEVNKQIFEDHEAKEIVLE